MEPSADEVGRMLPVFSPKLAGRICLVDSLVIDLLTRRNYSKGRTIRKLMGGGGGGRGTNKIFTQCKIK